MNIILKSPSTPYSIYLRGTIGVKAKGSGVKHGRKEKVKHVFDLALREYRGNVGLYRDYVGVK